ncbi:MAG: hypothetical protein FIA97_16525 [Methylococcaceae bacterium]|nr:hypothetical protein [Methylococcaceae bacterium]
MQPYQLAQEIYDSATPILRIVSLGGKKWRRNDKEQRARTGPWLSANYEVLDRNAWEARHACIYFVAGDDNIIRYTGVSRNGVKHRWREATAIDAETGIKRMRKELHHSQCWQHIEREYKNRPNSTFEVRTMSGFQLAPVLKRLGPPLSGLLVLENDHEGLVSALERWLCNNQSSRLVTWNIAMTRSQNAV